MTLLPKAAALADVLLPSPLWSARAQTFEELTKAGQEAFRRGDHQRALEAGRTVRLRQPRIVEAAERRCSIVM